jgi:hypothetical protein
MLGTNKLDYAKKYCLLHAVRSYQGKIFKVCDSLVCKGISLLLALFPKLWLLWAVCRAVIRYANKQQQQHSLLSQASWGRLLFVMLSGGKIYAVHVETKYSEP